MTIALNLPDNHPRRCTANKHRRHWADPAVPERCGQLAITDSDKCKFHGGNTNHALAKNFRARSTFLTGLPKKLARRIAAAASDPELTSLRTHIALLDDRVLALTHKLPTKESGQAWLALQEDHAELEQNLGTLKKSLPEELLQVDGFADALKRIDRCVESMFKNFRRTKAERELWSEILGHFEQRRRMAETEVKRENFLQANLTSRQTLTLFAALNAILQEELQGLPEVKKRVGARLSVLLVNDPSNKGGAFPKPKDTAQDAEYEVLSPGTAAAAAAVGGERET